MTSVIYAGIVATAASSCAWDVRHRRIPNVLTVGSAALGCCVHAIGGGLDGATFSAAGWLTGLLLFLPWFLAGGMGGGDVKLLAAYGAGLGAGQTVTACLFAMLSGGVLAMIILIRQGRLRPAIASVVSLAAPQYGAALLTPGMSSAQPARASLAYAVPVAIGVGIALWLR